MEGKKRETRKKNVKRERKLGTGDGGQMKGENEGTKEEEEEERKSERERDRGTQEERALITLCQ